MKSSVIVAVLLAFAAAASAQNRVLDSWKMRCEGMAEEFDAKTPATVAGVLADNGYFGKDILFGGNWFEVDKSIFDKTWTFSTEFGAKPSKNRFYTLRFEGLGYYANIDLNGQRIASADTTWGCLARRAFDVTDLVRNTNSISVSLDRAVNGDVNVGYVDWNPRPLDESMGILRDVVLCETGAVSIEEVGVRTDLDTKDFSIAEVRVNIILRNHSSKKVKAKIKASGEAGTIFRKVSLKPHETKEIDASIHLDNPRVWWTYALGSPELYEMKVEASCGGKLSDSRDVTFGVRSIDSYLIDGKYRQFVLNGRPVQILGAGWTDEILMRDTHESIASQVQRVKDMGLNCIRFEYPWGKDSFVYDECDRQGVLTIVGFTCQWEWEDYCGLPETRGVGCLNDPRSMDIAVRYFRDQVLWLRNHPSLIAWLTGSDRIPNKDLEARYMDIYNRYEYRPYVCSAKGMKSEYGGQSGFKMEGPYNYVGPEYWYIDKTHGGAYGFNSETGIGPNIPQVESMAMMMPADSLWPVSRSWAEHCTASNSDLVNNPGTLVSEVNAQYGEPSGLEGFMCRAHALDYDGTRAMFEAFRCNSDIATGVIQWMLNSAWPSMYWQLYDFWQNPTAGYYGVRKACTERSLIYNYGDRKVYGVATNHPGRYIARVMLFDRDSKLVCDQTVESELGDRAVALTPALEVDGGGYLSLELFDANGAPLSDNFYAIAASDTEFAWKKSNWCWTPSSRSRDLSFIEPSSLKCEVERTADGYEVRLTNDSDRISYSNRLALVDPQGRLVSSAYWSDNFVSVLPHRSISVSCKCSEEGKVVLDCWK